MKREYDEEKWIGFKTMAGICVVIGTAMWGLGLWTAWIFFSSGGL